jgi:NAD(P) transhydrogenase
MTEPGPSESSFDVVVIGAGPGGERAAIQAARAGKRVVLLERAPMIGGARVNWGTIPSKTLRESAVFFHTLAKDRLHGIRYEVDENVTVADFMYRERIIVESERALAYESLGRYAVPVLRGNARFVDPHTVALASPGGGPARLLHAGVIVIATGASPNRPQDVPFDREAVFDSDTILALPRIPKSMIVLGAGVIGLEYASIFAAMGVLVSLVDTRAQVLPYVDREIVGILEGALGRLGVTLHHEDRHARIERVPRHGEGPDAVRCVTRKGLTLDADVLLYCVGRDGNTKDLGLEALGIVPNSYGLLAVNENFQTIHPNVYAVGDVIGYPSLASTSMEQGRRAVRHAFGLAGPLAKPEVLPFAIYSIPEVSYIGETEEQLAGRGIAYVAGRGNYALNPRGQILGDTEGLLKLLFEADTGRLVGVHIVGHSASELVHIGQAHLRAEATAEQIADQIYNYPTLSDLYRHAALTAANRMAR